MKTRQPLTEEEGSSHYPQKPPHRKRHLRSQHRWRKDVRPQVLNPYRRNLSGHRILPGFVPAAIEAKICRLSHISYLSLSQLDLSQAGMDRAAALQSIRNAVRYQQHTFQRIQRLLRVSHAEHHKADESGQVEPFHSSPSRDDVPIGMEQPQLSHTSDDFLFKEPTPPTRTAHPSEPEPAYTYNYILEENQRCQLSQYFFQ